MLLSGAVVGSGVEAENVELVKSGQKDGRFYGMKGRRGVCIVGASLTQL
jgi:hypothetical protein